MRTMVALLVVAGLISAPLAIAEPRPGVSALLIQRFDDGTTLLAWTPVAGASHYVVSRGATAATLEVVATTSDTHVVLPWSATGDHFAVTAIIDGAGADSSNTGGGGDCVSSGGGGVSVTTGSCATVK